MSDDTDFEPELPPCDGSGWVHFDKTCHTWTNCPCDDSADVECPGCVECVPDDECEECDL